jgi:hypothetical protein
MFALSNVGHIQSLVNPPGNPEGDLLRRRRARGRTRCSGSAVPGRSAGRGASTGQTGCLSVPMTRWRRQRCWAATVTPHATRLPACTSETACLPRTLLKFRCGIWRSCQPVLGLRGMIFLDGGLEQMAQQLLEPGGRHRATR